jgi:hypothetical protein
MTMIRGRDRDVYLLAKSEKRCSEDRSINVQYYKFVAVRQKGRISQLLAQRSAFVSFQGTGW